MSLRNRIIGHGEVDPALGILNSCPGFCFAMASTTKGGQVGKCVGGGNVVTEQAERPDVVNVAMPGVVGGDAACLASATISLQGGPSGSSPSGSVPSLTAHAARIGAIARPTDAPGETLSGTEGSVGGLLAPSRREEINGLGASGAINRDVFRGSQSLQSGALGGAKDAGALFSRSSYPEFDPATLAYEQSRCICGSFVLGVLAATKDVVWTEPIKAPAVDQYVIPAECARRGKHVVDALEVWIGRVIAYVTRMRMLYLAPASAHAKLRFSIHPSILGDCL